MHILLIEPFFAGSHQVWAEGLQQHSGHEVELLTLPGRHWKWRMHGAAVTLAQQFLQAERQPDLILATDMLHLPVFLSLTRQKLSATPVALYFHENQLTYPWSPTDVDVRKQRDNHYCFINYASALAADAVFFNSHYHRRSFLEALPEFLQQFPDFQNVDTILDIRRKSDVLPLGMNLAKFDDHAWVAKNDTPLILWNHRWEYDKNPELFFETLFALDAEGLDFELVVLGERYRNSPPIFAKAKEKLAHRILHVGYTEDFSSYAHWLWRADIAVTTAVQDFFGGSVVEAIYCQCFPLLPHRLAYPEHVPEDLHGAVFHESAEDLKVKLRQLLRKHTYRAYGPILADFVRKYDWGNLRYQYEIAFEQLRQL